MSGVIAGAVAAIAAVGISAYGAVSSSEAASSAEKYNAQIAANNAAIATQNAKYAGAAGEAQAEQASLQTRAKVGGIIANEAAGNIDVNSGSALDVRSSAQQLGELNAITIKSNAARQAYGYETQSSSEAAQQQLDTSSAANATTSGDIGAGASVFGGLGSAANNYAKFTQAGGGNNISGGNSISGN